MLSLPVISGREVVKGFEKAGWEVVRQRGSHMILVKEGSMAPFRFPIIGRLPGEPCEA